MTQPAANPNTLRPAPGPNAGTIYERRNLAFDWYRLRYGKAAA